MKRNRGAFDKILILDFGSQYTQLIARRVRECQIYSEIQPFSISVEAIQSIAPRGIILSGGPASVYEAGAPQCDPQLFEMGIPILGICYGMQLMGHLLKGEVAPSSKREYGKAPLTIAGKGTLFKGMGQPGSSMTVWMSHGDHLKKLPPGFRSVAYSKNTPFAAIEDPKRKLYGLQFHPEGVHTPRGIEMIRNFLFEVCQCSSLWTMESFVDEAEEAIRKRVAKGKVNCALSGGVDSTVVALLLHRAIGDQLSCIFVDNGLLRKNEAAEVVNLFQRYFKIPLNHLRA
jgi:GMP synthase (glutamine-hydrolysing)